MDGVLDLFNCSETFESCLNGSDTIHDFFRAINTINGLSLIDASARGKICMMANKIDVTVFAYKQDNVQVRGLEIQIPVCNSCFRESCSYESQFYFLDDDQIGRLNEKFPENFYLNTKSDDEIYNHIYPNKKYAI